MTVIDASHHAVVPGLINTHHHLYQTFQRNVPAVQDVELFDWLKTLYEIWREVTPEIVHVSALVGLGELLLSGCTTSTDHFYVFPRRAGGRLVDEEIRAADDLGIRFHPTRGSMSRGVSQGGLPPDDVVQTPEEILKDSERVIQRYHDPARYSMCRVGLAPCSPFSVTTELLRDAVSLARQYGVQCHTHLAETLDEERYCLEMHKMRPLAYMESVGWTGPDIWFAHAVHLNDGEIRRMAETKTGVAHCPTSNLRLASGIAPVRKMLDAGVPVGLGVDGSASNDSSQMIAEARMAMLVHRVAAPSAGRPSGVSSMPAEAALRMATRGGAAVLGRDDLGSLAPGKAADIALFDLRRIEFAGAMHDPLAALVFCAPVRADMVIVNGKVVVKGGRLTALDEGPLVDRANRLAGTMIRRASRRTGRKFLVRA